MPQGTKQFRQDGNLGMEEINVAEKEPNSVKIAFINCFNSLLNHCIFMYILQ